MTDTNHRRRLWQALCLIVTLLTGAYVVQCIQWQDKVIGSETFVGRIERDADGTRRLHTADGARIALDGRTVVPGIVTLLRETRPAWLAAGFLVCVISLWLMGLRWQWLLRSEGLDPGLWETTRMTWLGAFAGNFFPGSTGVDIAKIVCICRRAPQRRIAAVMTVFFSRLIGMLSLFTIGFAALMMLPAEPNLVHARYTACAFVVAAAVVGVACSSRRLHDKLQPAALLAKLPQGQRFVAAWDCLRHYARRPGLMFGCLALSLAMQILTILAIAMLGEAIGMQVGLMHYFVFVPVVFVAASAMPAINGLGVREGAFQVLFAMAGATPSQALALSVLHRGVGLLISLPGAVVFHREVRGQATSRIALVAEA